MHHYNPTVNYYLGQYYATTKDQLALFFTISLWIDRENTYMHNIRYKI
jgi:hypothetical protein